MIVHNDTMIVPNARDTSACMHRPTYTAWMLINDTITTHFEGKNTYDLSVPCE